jgi:hypothetical protein
VGRVNIADRLAHHATVTARRISRRSALERFGFDGAVDSDGVQVIIFAVPIDHHFGHALVYGANDDHSIRAAMSQHLGAFDLFNCAAYRSFGTELGNFSLSHHDWHRERCHQNPPA